MFHDPPSNAGDGSDAAAGVPGDGETAEPTPAEATPTGGRPAPARRWPLAPLPGRVIGAVLALAGAALLLVGFLTLRGHPGGQPPSGAAGTSRSPSVSPSPGTGEQPTTAGTATAGTPTAGTSGSVTSPSRAPSPTAASPPAPVPTTTRAPVARAPVTVLNNSTVTGLGARVAAQLRARGWQVAAVGNFAGRIPVTTVYFTAGDAAQERAARELAAEFPRVRRVFPRYEGLPPTPEGIVLVVTRDWLG